MKLLSYLRRGVLGLLAGMLLLTILLSILLIWRFFSFGQEDDATRVSSKASYLENLPRVVNTGADLPNIVFILFDDLGYGDIGFGAAGNDMIRTPNIDRLASDGIMLSDFHSPAAVCTPSRTGFLTGRLAPRAGLSSVVFPSGSIKEIIISRLLNPEGNVRLPEEEITLADILRASGYRTGMVGKWHLGDRSPSLPNDRGFESYFGALYSNDMEPFALYRDREIAVEAPVDQDYLTEHYVEAATDFIRRQTGEPFFLYFAHNFPHDPLHVRESRSGQSPAGLFGDVMEEIDDAIAAIMLSLEQSGQLDNTLIIMSSDNGPWYLGNAGDQRGRKGNTFEGGMRVPFIAHWPGRIAAGQTSGAMAMGTDLLPTVLDLLKLPAPPDRILDGRSILPVLTEGAATPHDYLYYYDSETLFAVRDQRFKYRRPAGVFYGTDSMPMAGAVPQKEWLFDLEGDPRESYDTSDRHPEALQRLRAAFSAKTDEMEQNRRGWK